MKNINVSLTTIMWPWEIKSSFFKIVFQIWQVICICISFIINAIDVNNGLYVIKTKDKSV